jgi:hypothetical protein
MRFTLGLVVVMGAPWAAMAADLLTQGERDYAMSNLHATRKLFLDSVVGLSHEQWTWKPSPDRWSAAECAEHIAVTEEFVAGLVKQMLQAPPTPEKRIPADQARPKDERIVMLVSDRSRKVQAPEQVRPANRFKTPEQAVEHFKKVRDANIHYVMTTDANLRDRFAPHPFLGPLDLYQWHLFVSAHSERHTKQLLEVKADSGFPKK